MYPLIGDKPMRPLDTTSAPVLEVLEPIWTTKTQTAKCVLFLLSRTFRWAMSKNYCDRNPAAWDILVNSLPKPDDFHVAEERPGLDWRRIPAFMAALSEFEQSSFIALRFAILNWTRISESTGAPWVEFDLDNALWEVPWQRHKNGKKNGRKPLIRPLGPVSLEILSHRDALQLTPRQMRLAPKRDAVMAVLRTIENLDEVNIRAIARQCDCTWEVVRLALIKLKKAKQASPHRSAFVFPGISRKGIDDKPIGGRGVNYELEKTFLPKHPEFADVDFTVHGFRSSAASWARENFRSDFPEPELLRKLQLGHVVSPGALGRYERGQLIEARRPLVEAWDIERDGVEGLAEIVIAVSNEIGFRGLLEEVVFAHVLDDRRRRAPARLSLVKSDDPGPDAA